MIRGQAGPLFVVNGVELQMPPVKKGGRKERFKPIGKVYYTNIHNDRVFNPNVQYDFSAEYTWDRLDIPIVESLINIKNNAETVNLYPHSDFKAFRISVVIAEFDIMGTKGYSYADGVKMKCLSVSPRRKLPSLNNMYVGKFPTRVAIIN